MEKLSTVVYGVIALVVVVLLIFTVAIPVIESASESQVTTGQNTTQRYILKENFTDAEISINNGVVSIGDYDLTLQGSGDVIAMSDSFYVWASSGNNTLLVRSVDGKFSVASLSISNGAMTFTSGGTEHTITYTDALLLASDKGTYGMFPINSEIRFNKDSVLFTTFDSSVTNDQLTPSSVGTVALMKGTYDNLQTLFVFENEDSITTAEFTGTFSQTPIENDGYYSFNNTRINGTLTTNLGDYSGSNFYQAILAPIDYTYISDNDSMIITLLGVIPLMLVIVPVMLAVQLMTGGRRD